METDPEEINDLGNAHGWRASEEWAAQESDLPCLTFHVGSCKFEHDENAAKVTHSSFVFMAQSKLEACSRKKNPIEVIIKAKKERQDY